MTRCLSGLQKPPDVIEPSVKKMIFADEEGQYDRLLNFVNTMSGAPYFAPPVHFIDSLSG